MKRKYAKPSMNIDIFEGNEYIATCIVGVCDTPISFRGNKNVMYEELNEEIGYQEGDRRIKRINGTRVDNNPCNKGFTGRDGKVYKYMYDPDGTDSEGSVRTVYFWQVIKPFYYNHHATSGYKETGSSTA